MLANLQKPAQDAGEVLRLEAAFSLCSRGELSTSQAARLAGMSYADFLQAAAGARVELYPVRAEELAEEAQQGFTLGRPCLPSHPAGEGETP